MPSRDGTKHYEVIYTSIACRLIAALQLREGIGVLKIAQLNCGSVVELKTASLYNEDIFTKEIRMSR